MAHTPHSIPDSAADGGIQLTSAEKSVLNDIITWYLAEHDVETGVEADLDLLLTEIETKHALVNTEPALNHLPDNIISSYADAMERAVFDLDNADTIFAFYDTVFRGLAEKIGKE